MIKKILFSLFLVLFISISACDKQPATAIELFDSQEYDKAFSLFKPLAEEGDPEAQNYLGMIYYLGLHGHRDAVKAESWFEKAAKQKHASAQLNFGMMIENNATKPLDFVTSYMWYFAAGENGNKKAEKRIQHLVEHHRLFGTQRSYAEKQAVVYINYNQYQLNATKQESIETDLNAGSPIKIEVYESNQ